MSTGFPPPSLVTLAERASKLLKERKQKICFVETACGGLISSTFLSLPGASAIFSGAQTLYTLPSRLLYGGWTSSSLENYTGPTPEIVENLAKHVLTQFQTHDEDAAWCVAESGTAGPTGGETRNRMPGYVAFAVVGKGKGEGAEGGVVLSQEFETGSKERVDNMVSFAEKALELLVEALEKES